MFKRMNKNDHKDNMTIALQKEIYEIVDIFDKQQKQIECLNEILITLYELCNKEKER